MKLLLFCLLAASCALAGDVQLVNAHFRTPGGELFIPLGGFYGNWVPTMEGGVLGPGRNFQDLDESEWDRWLSLLADHGCTAVRVFCRAHREWQGHKTEQTLDAGGHVDPELWATFERYFACGAGHGLRFQMTLLSEPRGSIYVHWAPVVFAQPQYLKHGWPFHRFVGPQVGQRRLLDSQAEYFTDPEAVALQKQYLAELLTKLAEVPNVFTVELYNEMAWNGDFMWETQDVETAWAREMVSVVSGIAPDLPVCFSLAGHGMTGIDPVRWAKAIPVDFFSSHFYPSISGEDESLDYGASAALVHDYAAAVLPGFPGESGVLDPAVPDEARRLALRDCLWLTLAGGGAGYMQWPMERQPVAHLTEYRKARDFLSGEDWLAGEAAPAPLTVDITANCAFFGASTSRQEKLESSLLDALRQYERRSLDDCIPLAFTLGPAMADGAVLDEAAFSRVKPTFRLSPGYQGRYVLSADGGAGLLYARNYEPLTFGRYHLRQTEPRPFSLQAHLPPGTYRFTVLDLGSGEEHEVTVQSPGVVWEAPQAEADYAVKFRRM